MVLAPHRRAGSLCGARVTPRQPIAPARRPARCRLWPTQSEALGRSIEGFVVLIIGSPPGTADRL